MASDYGNLGACIYDPRRFEIKIPQPQATNCCMMQEVSSAGRFQLSPHGTSTFPSVGLILRAAMALT